MDSGFFDSTKRIYASLSNYSSTSKLVTWSSNQTMCGQIPSMNRLKGPFNESWILVSV